LFDFSPRARGDWDGFSDTALLVVAADPDVAQHWPAVSLARASPRAWC
jgi:hypothetical protein